MRPAAGHLRKVGLVMTAAVTVVGAAACGNDSGGSSGKVGAITGAAASSVVPWAASGQAPDSTVTVCYFSGPEFDAIQHYSTEFTQLTGGKIKIKMVSIPINQALPATINQIRTSSTCDLVDAGGQQAADINPYLVPLKSMMDDPGLFNTSVYNLNDFPQGVQAVASQPGKGLMSFTFGADVQMLYYRKDLLDKWGIKVPVAPQAWTWDEMESALRTIQSKIQQEKLAMSPISISGTQDAGAAMFSLGAMWGFGADPFKGDKPTFTDPKALDGLTHWTGLLTQLKVASPGSPTYAYNELLAALQQGKTAMAVEWNAAAATLDDPKLSPKSAGKLGYALLPYATGMPANTPRVFPTTHTLGISANSKVQREAFEFAAWYTSPDVAKRMVSEGRGSSGRVSALTDPAVVAKQRALGNVGESVKLYHVIPNIPSFGDLLLNVMGPAVNGAFTGQASPQQALQNMQSGSENLLKKAGK
jgi:ABC-type glycerol-3-phosphate transport system substrate-binding protein